MPCRRPITPAVWTGKCWPRSALKSPPAPDLATWDYINARIRNPEGDVTIAIVGKYTGMKDAYKSLIEALSHGGIANKVKVNLDWIESEVFENEDPAPYLEHVDGILVPGGFGQRGTEGKIRAAQFARERQVPYFGICFGMQMAVIEAARNLCGIEDANSTEFGATREPIVGLMTEWMKGNELQKRGRQRRSRRHHAARRLSGLACSAAAASPTSIRRPRFPSATATATRSTPPTKTAWRSTACAFPACRPTAYCRKSSNTTTIPGLSACNSIPN